MSSQTSPKISLDQAASDLNFKTESVSLNPLAESFHITMGKREDTRSTIAILIVVSLPVIVAASFLTLWFFSQVSIDGLLKIVGAIMSPVIGLVGAVTGFYFSESKHRDLNH